MRASLLLLTYAVVLATLGGALLRRATWVDRAPGLGMLAWQALSGSIVASVVLGGLALTVPAVPVAASLAKLLRACASMIQAQYATPGGAAASSVGLVLTVLVAGRTGFCIARALRVAAADRRRHLEVLALVGRPAQRLGATVVEHDIAEAYCLPGRQGRIVLTSGALDALDTEQLAAILAHERAHLRARHHLPIAVATSLAEAFPRIRVFALAQQQIRSLLELAADDAAVRHGDRLALAEGILTVAGGRTPAATLGAGDTAAAQRVRRLLASPARRAACHAGTGRRRSALRRPAVGGHRTCRHCRGGLLLPTTAGGSAADPAVERVLTRSAPE